MGKFGAGGSDQVNEHGHGNEAGDHLQHMQSDASLTDPANSRLAQAETFKFDGPQFIKDNYGSDEGFLAAQPGELRQQLGLPEGATSEQVFQTMAKQATELLKKHYKGYIPCEVVLNNEGKSVWNKVGEVPEKDVARVIGEQIKN